MNTRVGHTDHPAKQRPSLGAFTQIFPRQNPAICQDYLNFFFGFMKRKLQLLAEGNEAKNRK